MKSLIASTLILLIPLSLIFGQWTTSVSKDEMTGKKSCYASSPSTSATQKMDFPYSDVRAWLGVGTNGSSEWTYIGFSQAPNIANDETKDGYSRIETRIKWDDKIETVSLRQDWGSSFIHFYTDNYIIEKIAQSSTVLLELDWYGEGSTFFRFSLRESAAALAKIRNSCSGN